ncbi:MAG: hypothetical protein JKY50_22555 [Oleispira sp.]|nr:hypothetical protein [Oleispira sp.]
MKRYNLKPDSLRGVVESYDGAYVLSSDVNALQAELDAYKAHMAEIKKAYAGFNESATTGDKFKLFRVIAKTPAQSLNDVRAKAVTDLIAECSYSTQVNGIATSIIDVDSAISYADKLGEG